MKRLAPLTALAIGLGVALVIGFGGAAKSKTASLPARAAIGLRSTPLGRTLVDGKGRTLYLFRGDSPNVSRLSSAGLAVWPPFDAAAKPKALDGASTAKIGLSAGIGGRSQVTYGGHPLYYYAGDH